MIKLNLFRISERSRWSVRSADKAKTPPSIHSTLSVFRLCFAVVFGAIACFFLFLSLAGTTPASAQADPICDIQDEFVSDSPLLFNEIMADNNGSLIDPADGKDNEDWIELYNPSSQSVDIRGLFLSDRLGELRKHRITQTLTIEPFGFLVLILDGETDQGPEHLSFKLNNSGEAIVLTESDGVTIIDSCIFSQQEENRPIGRLPDGGEWTNLSSATVGIPNAFLPVIDNVLNNPEIPSAFQPTTVSAFVSDDLGVASVTLIYSSTNLLTQASSPLNQVVLTPEGNDLYQGPFPRFPDNTLVSYYIEAVDTSGGIIQSPIDAPTSTHRYRVGYEPPSIAINEIMAANSMSLLDPDEPITATVSNKYPDWFELYNYGTTFVNLNGLYLTDDRYKPTKNPITGTLFVAPGSTVIIYADEDRRQGVDHVNFKLSASGETVAIFGPYGASPIDLVDFREQGVDHVIGRFPDGTGALTLDLCRTPGAANILCNVKTFLPSVPSANQFR